MLRDPVAEAVYATRPDPVLERSLAQLIRQEGFSTVTLGEREDASRYAGRHPCLFRESTAFIEIYEPYTTKILFWKRQRHRQVAELFVPGLINRCELRVLDEEKYPQIEALGQKLLASGLHVEIPHQLLYRCAQSLRQQGIEARVHEQWLSPHDATIKRLTPNVAQMMQREYTGPHEHQAWLEPLRQQQVTELARILLADPRSAVLQTLAGRMITGTMYHFPEFWLFDLHTQQPQPLVDAAQRLWQEYERPILLTGSVPDRLIGQKY